VIRAPATVAWRAFVRFIDHGGPDRAAAVAYYALLSLLPLLIFLISLAMKLFGSFDAAYDRTLLLFRGVVIHLDQRSLEFLRGFVENATRFQWPGILLLAWTSRRMFASLFGALENVFGVPGRGFAKGNLVALAMVIATGVALLLSLVFTMAVATTEGLIVRITGERGLQTFHDLTGLLLSNFMPIGVTFAFFFIVYWVAPRRVVSSLDAAVGATIATLLWEAARTAFAYYVRNLAHFAGLYGAMEAVIVLALWLELSVSIILYCGEIVALLIGPRTSSSVSVA
jgi:membrane protein